MLRRRAAHVHGRHGRDPLGGALPSDALDALDLVGVSLVASTEAGLVDVPGLQLVFDRRGCTVHGPEGEPVATIPWSRVRSVTFDLEPGAHPGAPARVGIEVETDLRRHRFIVPQSDLAALREVLAAIGERHGGRQLAEVVRGRALRR